MEYIQSGFRVLAIVFIYIGIIKVLMKIFGYIGEKLGIAKNLMKLWQSTIRRIKHLTHT